MKKISLSLLLAGAFLTQQLRAQAPPPAASVTCLPSGTLDELIKAIDDAVSGPGDKDRACLKALLLPEARLSPLAKAQDGSYTPHILTVDGWIEAVRKRGSAAFYERQVKVSSDIYGHIAHLWSTYEVRPTPDGKAQVRGINSIQAINDGNRWRVIEILWEAETPAETIPARYLP
ncbi:hypothetical protein [Acidicapsa acidisoli]|uniref:hypothetical protein n=1 Tax=Acidicapsa acidisoli TaxID=1615681 RepID=UPI0021E05E42|nr:hypothetical protein [Acidicapsa acidisoli]